MCGGARTPVATLAEDLVSRSTRLLVASAALAFCVLICSHGASACSVCLAGDPVYSSQGTSAQAQGDVSVYFEAKGWRKESGVLPGEHVEPAPGEEVELEPPGKERNDSQRLD